MSYIICLRNVTLTLSENAFPGESHLQQAAEALRQINEFLSHLDATVSLQPPPDMEGCLLVEPSDVWEEDAIHTREEWRWDVAGENTNLGYWEWVRHRQQAPRDATDTKTL